MKRLIVAVIMTSWLTACTAWRVQEAPSQKPSPLRITLTDGRRLVLRDAQVLGDSLVGFAAEGQARPSERVRVAFLTAGLQRMEGSRLDAGKTGLAVIGLAAVIGLVVAVRNVQTTDPNH